jgi:hypothetical protein
MFSGPDDAYCIPTGLNSIANPGSFDAIGDQTNVDPIAFDTKHSCLSVVAVGVCWIMLTTASIDCAFGMDRMIPLP